MNTTEIMAMYQTATGQLVRLYMERAQKDKPEIAALVTEAIAEGSGKVGISIIPHKPMEVTMVMYNDQGGQVELLRLTAEHA